MKSKIIYAAILATTASIALAMPAFAIVSASGANAAANKVQAVENRIQNGLDRGDTMLTNRVNDLNKLITRIQAMKNLSDAQKASFASSVQTVITDLNALEAKLKSDTSTTTLRADLKTIAPDYRVYLLVMPQLSLLSAVDRVNTIVGTLQAVATKIQTRVSANPALSGNATITADLSDMSAKLADATAKAAAAQTEIAGLVPDNGVQTVMQSNTAALKDARTKIQTAQKDLEAARKDAKAVVEIIVQSSKNSGTASSTSSH